MAVAVLNPENLDEKYKVTRGELLELSRWAAAGGDGDKSARPPWLPGNVDYTEIRLRYKNIIDQALSVGGAESSEIGLTSPTQLEALNSLRGFKSLPQSTETYTKGSFQKELEEWRLRSVKLPMTRDQRLEVDRKIKTVSNLVNATPGGANAIVRFGEDIEAMNAYSTFRGLLEQARDINPFEVAANQIKQDIARDRAEAAQKRAQQQQQAPKEEEENKEPPPPPPAPGQLEAEQAKLIREQAEKNGKDGPSLEEQARRAQNGEAVITPEEQAKVDQAARDRAPEQQQQQAPIDQAEQQPTPNQETPQAEQRTQNAQQPAAPTEQLETEPTQAEQTPQFNIAVDSSDIKTGETYEARARANGAQGSVTYRVVNDPNSAAEVSIDENGNISSSDKITDGEIIYRVIAEDEYGNVQSVDVAAQVSFKADVSIEDSKDEEVKAQQNAASSQNQTEPQDQQQPTQQQDSAQPDAPVQQVDTVKGTVSNGVLKKSIRAAVKPISDKTTGRLAKRYRGALDRRDEYSDNGLAGRFTLKALYKEMRKERAAYQNNKIFQSRAEMLDEALSTGNVILLTQLPKIPKQKGYGKIFRKQLKESVKDNSVLLLYAGADLLGAGVRKASGAIKDGTPESLKSTIVKSKTKIRDAKKKAKDSTKELGSFIATQAIKRIILRPIEQIREVVEQVRETGRGLSRYRLARRFVNSNTGQWVSTKFSNFKNTRIGSGLSNILKLESVDDVHSGMSRVGGSITRVYRSGSDLLMRSATSTGAILKGGIGVARIGGAYVSALPYGILGAIGAGAVAFGTLGAGAVVPAAAVGGSVLVAAKGTDNFLRLDPTKFARIAYDPAATPTLFRPFVRASAYISNGARNFLIRNGYGQFFTQDAAVTRFNYGAANTQQGQYALVGNRGNIYSGFARGVRAINSGLTVGSIFAVGGLALGVNPLLAGAVGVGVGVGGRLAIDAFRGSRLYNAINLGSKVPAWANALSHIPANAILGSTLGNIWLGNQIGILRNQYGGNVLEYFKGEYIDGLGNLKGDPAGFLMAAGNWLGAAGYISSAKALAAFGGTAAASVATRLGVTVPAGTSLTAPVLAGTAVGTLVGLGIALAFGLPLTTTVITGALIGGAIGGTIGGVLGGVATFFTGGALAPTVFWFATAGASIGSTIGAWIGSTVENAFNDIFKGYLSALNGLSSLMALFHLLKAGMDMDQIVPLALAIITLASMLNKGGILQASNECLPEDEVCTGVNPLAAEGINEMYIAHYNVTLIGVDATVWTQDNIKTVLRALNDVGSDTIAERTSGKKIYITLGEEGTYVEDKFILIGFSNTAFSSPEEFAEIFTNELNSIANTTPTIEQTTSLNFQ